MNTNSNADDNMNLSHRPPRTVLGRRKTRPAGKAALEFEREDPGGNALLQLTEGPSVVPLGDQAGNLWSSLPRLVLL